MPKYLAIQTDVGPNTMLSWGIAKRMTGDRYALIAKGMTYHDVNESVRLMNAQQQFEFVTEDDGAPGSVTDFDSIAKG